MVDSDSVIDRPGSPAALRTAVARLEHGSATSASETVSLCYPIGRVLPGNGLRRGAVHEVLTGGPGAAAGFCALILARTRRSCGVDCTRTRSLAGGDTRFWPVTSRLDSGPCEVVEGPAVGLRGGSSIGQCNWGRLDVERAAARSCRCASASARSRTRRRHRPARHGRHDVGPALRRKNPLAGSAPSQRSADPCWQLTLLRASGSHPAAWLVTWDRAVQVLMMTQGGMRTDARALPASA
jgi:protein ImuA